MKRYFHRYSVKSKQIIGLTLGIIGLLILISVIPIKFLLSLIGIGFLAIGFLLMKIK
mgnify:FL=1|jgi:small-conductance mechanosensitive channel